MMATPNTPLWEVFIRSRNGLAHKHVGSLHAADATLALQAARDIYTRRGEGLSIWVVPSNAITASDPGRQGHDVRAGGIQDLSPSDILRRAGRSRAYVTAFSGVLTSLRAQRSNP
jgi:ring-1,2-phenylacetyl-CoA epoxidase subunit PaaB